MIPILISNLITNLETGLSAKSIHLTHPPKNNYNHLICYLDHQFITQSASNKYPQIHILFKYICLLSLSSKYQIITPVFFYAMLTKPLKRDSRRGRNIVSKI